MKPLFVSLRGAACRVPWERRQGRDGKGKRAHEQTCKKGRQSPSPAALFLFIMFAKKPPVLEKDRQFLFIDLFLGGRKKAPSFFGHILFLLILFLATPRVLVLRCE